MKKNCVICSKEFNCVPSDYNRYFCCSLECKYKRHTLTPEQQFNRLKSVFEKNVIIQEGCWGWKGEVSSSGYGRISYSSKRMQLHRVSWMIYYSEIPDGMWVLHKCDNPICSNPEHLFLGTHNDNVQDMISKGRRIIPKKKYLGFYDLSNDDILEIKKLLANKSLKKDIANKFGIGPWTVTRIEEGIYK
jgi:hypothetical protein